jgi:hypothetical protein
MHYLHTLYIDGASVAEIEIRVEPYLTRTDELALELSVDNLDGRQHGIQDAELLSIILAKHRDELWRIALEKSRELV